MTNCLLFDYGKVQCTHLGLEFSPIKQNRSVEVVDVPSYGSEERVVDRTRQQHHTLMLHRLPLGWGFPDILLKILTQLSLERTVPSALRCFSMEHRKSRKWLILTKKGEKSPRQKSPFSTVFFYTFVKFGTRSIVYAFSLHDDLIGWRSLTYFPMDPKVVEFAGPRTRDPPTAWYLSVISLIFFFQGLLDVGLRILGTLWLEKVASPAVRFHFMGLRKSRRWLISPLQHGSALWCCVGVSWSLVTLEP